LSFSLLRRGVCQHACSALVSFSLLVSNGALVRGEQPASTNTRIFVEGFGSKPQAEELKSELIRELRKRKDVNVAESRAAANMILSGEAEVYVRSYMSLYARAGTSVRHGSPIYGGYASVELKNSSGEVVWSYLATLHEGSKDASHELSKDIVKHLVASLSNANEKK